MEEDFDWAGSLIDPDDSDNSVLSFLRFPALRAPRGLRSQSHPLYLAMTTA